MKKGRYVRGTSIAADNKATVSANTPSPTINANLEPISDENGRGFFAKHFPILLIILLTAGIYHVNFNNELTNWDDDKYIDQNPLLRDFSGDAVYRMFFSKDNGERYFMGNYHPLTMLTLNIDYHYSDLDSCGKAKTSRFIAVNIILHL